MVQDAEAQRFSTKSLSRPAIAAIAAATLLTAGGSLYMVLQFQSAKSAPPAEMTRPPAAKTVTALARLEPAGEMVTLSAPASAEGSRIEALQVKEGEQVAKGQVIAILDSRDRLQAALEQAQEEVRIAEANVARVQAGAKTGEIAAQRATIARLAAEQSGDLETQAATISRLQAEWQNAQIEYQRYDDLYRQGAISASLRDSKQLTLQTAADKLREAEATLNRTRNSRQQQLHEAQATLNRIAEVRPVDVQVAQADVGAAIAAVKRAQANLAQAYVRAPQAGQILTIQARPGELVSANGIVTIGQTDRMYAVAEVYESDVSKVQVGQAVRLSSAAIAGDLHGTVERTGLQVQRQTVTNTDPAANTDARVVEVRIRLDAASSRKAAGLTNLQLKAVISQ